MVAREELACHMGLGMALFSGIVDCYAGLVSLIVTLARLPPLWIAGRIGLYAPLLWFFSLRTFRKNRLAERRTQAKAAQPLNASQDETVWPPAPLK